MRVNHAGLLWGGSGETGESIVCLDLLITKHKIAMSCTFSIKSNFGLGVRGR